MLIGVSRSRNLFHRVAACHDGSTAVEVSLTLPFLVLLAFGAFDYGSAYVEGVRLNGASRGGAPQSL